MHIQERQKIKIRLVKAEIMSVDAGPYCHLRTSSYRIAGNFRWYEFSRKSVQTLQKKFSRFLFSRMRDLWPHSYQLMVTPHMRNGTERRSDNGLIFLLYRGFRNYEVIKTAAAGEKPARWIQHC